MHYHCEIIMPPTDDIKGAVEKVLAPFDENYEGDEYESRYSFWDWWVIGGRWSGRKNQATYSPKAIEEFWAWCKEASVTVSSVTCGKQTLQPASQQSKVDAKWNEMFPSDIPIPCPLFSHSNDQYENADVGGLPGDVMLFKNVPCLSCERVIIAAPDWQGKLAASSMFSVEMWNGVNFQKTTWSGELVDAIVAHRDRLKTWKPEYQMTQNPKGDWLVVTVDYHS